jgi:hypothetical protein
MADYTIQGADPRWKRFEKLVARMLATLSPTRESCTTTPFEESLSEADRHIDVSLPTHAARPQQLVVVQCRDSKTPLDINAVGEFDSVARDVGAMKGIMVVVHGFTETAKTLRSRAQHLSASAS